MLADNPDIYSIHCVTEEKVVCDFPQLYPYLSEDMLRRLFPMILYWQMLFDEYYEEYKWEPVAKALSDGSFRQRDFFLERISHPLFLKIRRLLSSLGVGGLDTEPSPETEVMIPFEYGYPNTKLIEWAYPNRKVIRTEDPPADIAELKFRMKYRQIAMPHPLPEYFPLLPEEEIYKVTPKYLETSETFVESMGLKLVKGQFLAPDAFVDHIWSRRNCCARIGAIRMYPALVRYMKKSDLLELADIREVLQYALDRKWVTASNYEDACARLRDDETRAVLKAWADENDIYSKMEDLRQALLEADPFSLKAMRQNWVIHKEDDGYYIRLKAFVTSDVIYVPAEIEGKKVVALSLPYGDEKGPGTIPYKSITKVMVDSNIDSDLFFNKLSALLYLPPECRIESFGDGKLRITRKDGIICLKGNQK